MFGYSLGQLILEKTREEDLRHTDWKNVIGSCEAYFVGYDAGFGLSHLQTPDHKTMLCTEGLGLCQRYHTNT